MAIDVASLKASVTLDAGDFRRGIEDVRQELRSAQQEADRTSSSFENLGKVIDDVKTRSIIGMGRSISLAISAPLVLLGRELLDSAVKVDAWRRGLNTMTGSVAATREELEGLSKAALLPGITFQGAVQGAINLQAAGVSAEMAKREIVAYGNALAAAGRGAPEFQQVVTVLQHIHSLTYLSNREIRSLSVNIPQFRQQLLLAFGTAEGKELKERGLTAKEVMEGVLAQFEKLPKVTSSARNEIDNFFSRLFQAAAKVGDSLIPVVVILMHHIAPALEHVAEWFSHLSTEMRLSIAGFGLLAAAVGPPIFVMGLFLRSIQDIRVGLVGLQAVGTGVMTWFRGLTTVAEENTVAELHNAEATNTDTAAKVREQEVVATKTETLRANTIAEESNTAAEINNAAATTAAAGAHGWINQEVGGVSGLGRMDPARFGASSAAEGISDEAAYNFFAKGPGAGTAAAAALGIGAAGVGAGAAASGGAAAIGAGAIGAGAAGAAGFVGGAAIPGWTFSAQAGRYIPTGGLNAAARIPGGYVLLAALAAHMAKESMQEKDVGITAKHGEGGFIADIATGALPGGLIGGAIGTAIAPGIGSIIGAGAGALIGGGIGAYRFITGESERVKKENAQREKETTEAAQAESHRRALQKQLDALLKPPAPDFAEAQDAQYHAQLAEARARAREELSATPQQAQYDSTKQVMQDRQKLLKDRMAQLLPTIQTDPEDAKAYYKASQEAWTIEDQLSKMQVAASKERENLQKKAFRDQKDVQDSQFRALQYAAQAVGQMAPEGQRAQTYAGLAGPLVEARQRQLIEQAKILAPQVGKDVDQTKEYWSVVQEFWQLEEHHQAMIKAGVDERKQAQDKAVKLARETHVAAIEAQIEWATSQAANAAPGKVHAKELEVLLPVIQQQEREMIEEIQKTAPGSLEYYKLVKDYWSLEKRDQDIIRSAKQEADSEQKKARHEQLQTMELREKLLEGVMGNDPLTDDRTAKKRMVPLLVQHYKELLQPIQGESEIERLQREIEAQEVKKKLIEASGINRKGYASTIEGGRIPLFDIGAARLLDKQLRDIEGNSQDAMMRDAMGMSPGSQSPNGASSGGKLYNPWANRYLRDFGAEDAWKQQAANGYRDDMVHDTRSGFYSPNRWAEARSLANVAAGGNPVVLQILVSPGASRAERERAVREVLEKYTNELDPGPAGR